MPLLRSVATVGSYTLLSRIFGFVRDVLTAAILGAGPVADAFFVAQRLPNLFRSLFAEGAFSAAFVPLFSGTTYFDGGNSNHGMGNVSGTLDEFTSSGFLPNQSVAGTYSVSLSSNNGRGSILLTTPASTYSLWLISGSHFVAIDVDPSNAQPTVFEFEQ